MPYLPSASLFLAVLMFLTAVIFALGRSANVGAIGLPASNYEAATAAAAEALGVLERGLRVAAGSSTGGSSRSHRPRRWRVVAAA